jgi:hypothetical protein
MVHQAVDGAKRSAAPMLFGLRVMMLGRQGSGKGTQGVQLSRLLVVPHVSVGDVLREAARSETPAGRRAQETMERSSPATPRRRARADLKRLSVPLGYAPAWTKLHTLVS